MVSFSDIANGPKMLEEAFGTRLGRGLWRVVLGVVTIAVIAGGASETTSNAKSVLADLRSMLPSVLAQNTPALGNDNTIIGASAPASMGNGNTIVGPTDSNKDTLFTKGGTAIGAGACADSTSVAIGAGANAGACAHKNQP